MEHAAPYRGVDHRLVLCDIKKDSRPRRYHERSLISQPAFECHAVKFVPPRFHHDVIGVKADAADLLCPTGERAQRLRNISFVVPSGGKSVKSRSSENR